MGNRSLRDAAVALVLLGWAFLPQTSFAQEAVPNDAIGAGHLIQPAELAALIKTKPASAKPVLLHVGFPTLYPLAHIPGSVYAGPGSTPEGLKNLEKAVRKLPKSKPVVIYCGCCPWVHCPNVLPAFQKLRALGFKNVRVLRIDQNLRADWEEKGFPILTD